VDVKGSEDGMYMSGLVTINVFINSPPTGRIQLFPKRERGERRERKRKRIETSITNQRQPASSSETARPV